jgi:glycogen debranching enzyme
LPLYRWEARPEDCDGEFVRSAGNPAFNPYNYQTGSVWPHDNAIIALGFKRYGFDAEAAQIAHDISKAASYFQLNQLPELYTAFRRDETTFPV